MPSLLCQSQNILKCHLRRNIGITHYESSPVVLYLFYHLRLLFHRLGAIDKGKAAFLRKGQRRLQALDLNQVAREAIGLCAWEAGHWQVAVEEAMTDNPPPLYADRVLLEQVFLNLLRNAIEANREAHPGSPSRVVIGSRVEPGGLLCLWVRDQGPGVPADQLEDIFTPFHTSKPEGLGLGLSMSRSIVEGFGGTLEAELQADGGLLMNCRLPLAAGATGG